METLENKRFAGKNAQEWSTILGVYQDAVSKFARKSESLEAAVEYL